MKTRWLGGLVIAVGCGTTVSTPAPTESSSATSSSASSSASSASSSSTGGATGTGGAGGENTGLDCATVPELIQNLYEAAATCAPPDPVPHCQDIVDGFCCPVPVESIGSPATQAYLDFLELTQEQCPKLWEQCDLVDCAFPENVTCEPSANEPGTGTCTSQ